MKRLVYLFTLLLGFNSLLYSQLAYTIVDEMDVLTGWTNAGGSMDLNTTQYFSGTGSIKVTSNANEGNFIGKTVNLDLSEDNGASLRINIYPHTSISTITSILIYVKFGGGNWTDYGHFTIDAVNLIQGLWLKGTKGPWNHEAGTDDWAHVTGIRLMINNVGLDAAEVSFDLLNYGEEPQETYYISNNGDDANNGTTPATSWETINRLNVQPLNPGDSVLLKAMDTWRETLITNNGSSGKYITYSSYGSGVKPKILGSIDAKSTSDWVDLGNNIWYNNDDVSGDVGNIVFNNEESCGTKLMGEVITVSRSASTPSTYIGSNGNINLVTTSDIPRYSYSYSASDFVNTETLLDEGASTNKLINGSFDTNSAMSGDNIQYSGTNRWIMTYKNAGAATVTVSSTSLYSRSVQIAVTNQGSTTTAIKLRSVGEATTTAANYTVSFYVKCSASVSPGITICDAVGATLLDLGTFTTVANKWVRIAKTYSATARSDVGVLFNLGTMGTETFNFEGFQLELGDAATSLIPTTAGPLTRNAETLNLDTQGDFWCDYVKNGTLLYSTSNPGTFYSNIELVVRNIIQIGLRSYNNIIGLDLRYGHYGIVGGSTHHINISDCDISYIGGRDSNNDYVTRLGNAIEFYEICNDLIVERCRISQVFDAGITHQGYDAGTAEYNIYYRNNIIDKCEYSIEFYLKGGITSSMYNVYVENNTCTNAGGGWSHNQRTDGASGRHIRMGSNTCVLSDIYIRNNIFYEATESIYLLGNTASLTGINYDYNVLYQSSGPVAVVATTTYTTIADWQTASGQESHSIDDDPLFMSTSNLRLQSVSPAKDIGVTPIYNYDFVRHYRDDNPSIGAYEYGAWVYKKGTKILTLGGIPITKTQ
jgi:hypothetical protein